MVSDNLKYNPLREGLVFTGMNRLAHNASGMGREERLRLLALSMAILGLVLAPLGLSG